MKNNVIVFIKPFKDSDTEKGNPLAEEIITDLYRLGCDVNKVALYKLTPKMIIEHYDELVREGREKIVYSMVGDYCGQDLGDKLLNGGTLTEEELNRPGRPAIVMHLNIPESFTCYTDAKDDTKSNEGRPTMVVEGSIANFRKQIVGPTKMLSYFQMVDKVKKDNPEMKSDEVYAEAMKQYIPASNSVRYKYQYAGDGAKTTFNVMHCSANETDRDFEYNNFFVKWIDSAEVLDANKFNAYFEDRANTTEQIPQLKLCEMIRTDNLNSHFNAELFVEEPVEDNID